MEAAGNAPSTHRTDPRPGEQRPAPPPAAAAIRGAALWVLVVQCLLALSWTLYVLFLPSMLAAAGIERRWFVYVLIADQAIFAVCDRMAGIYADRVAPAWRRAGRIITVVTLVSSAALLAMPWVARPGNAVVLLFVIFLWAATSSALRAPVFALLGRVRDPAHRGPGASDTAAPARAGSVGIALVGISLGGAIGPYLTMLLKNVDSRLPIAVSAIALAAAGLWATRIEERLPRASDEPASNARSARRANHRAWSLAAVVLIAGFGTQVVTAIVALPLFQRFVGSDAVLWVAWFWAGFGVGLVPGSLLARDDAAGRPLLGAALALVVACVVFAIGARSDTVSALAAGVALAGGAWGVFTTVVFTSAVSLSGGRATVRGAGTAAGMLFSAFAVGTMLRLACVATGWNRASFMVWLPEIAWAIASVLLVILVRTVWRPHPADSPA